MKKGFTILELMITMVIVCMIFFVGFVLISGTSNLRSYSLARTQATVNARQLLEMINRDMSGAYSAGGFNRTTLVIPRAQLDGMNDCLQFLTKNETQMTNAFVLVRYYVNASQGVLCRQVLQANSLNDLPAPTDLPDLSKTDYAYFDGVYKFNVWGIKWDTTGGNRTFHSFIYHLTPPLPPVLSSDTNIQLKLILQPDQMTFSTITDIPSAL